MHSLHFPHQTANFQLHFSTVNTLGVSLFYIYAVIRVADAPTIYHAVKLSLFFFLPVGVVNVPLLV